MLRLQRKIGDLQTSLQMVCLVSVGQSAALFHRSSDHTYIIIYLLTAIIIIIIIYLLTAIGLLPGGSGYFTRKQNMKSVTTKFKSGGLHEKYVVATWNLGNRLSICL